MSPRVLIVIAISAIASIGQAHAATDIGQVLSTPPSTDIWRHMLEIVFPGVGPLGGEATSGTNAIASAAATFNASLLAIGTAVLMWHIITGLVATAHEGTVLGKRWHQVWAPIRVVAGIGMLVPVVKGFCLAQVLAITVACWSGSFGNALWSSYLDGLTSTSLSAPSLPATGAVVRTFSDAAICYAAVNQHRLETGFSKLPDVTPSQSNLTTAGGLAVTAGNSFNYLTSWVSGGSQTSAAASNRTLVSWDFGPCGSVSVPLALNPGGDDVVISFDTARLQAFNALQDSLSSTAENFAASLRSATGDGAVTQGKAAAAVAASAITAAKQSFDEAMTRAASASVGAGNDGALSSFQENARKAGWVSAGVYYSTISRLQTRVQQVADTLPALTVDRPADRAAADEGSYIKESATTQTGLIYAFNASFEKAAAAWSGGAVPDLSAGVKAGADGASPVSVAGVLNWLFRNCFSAIDTYVTGVSANLDAGPPLQQMSDFGSKILSAATVILLVGIPALFAAGGGFAAVLGATGLLGYIVSIAVAVGGVVLAVGVGHAYVLPMLPFIQFVFAVVSMLILVGEAVIAAPLWALMHIRADGDELVGQHQHAGYVILFNLFLRIPLTMFGLFLSLAVFQGGIWLLSVTFYPAMLAATANTSAGLVGAVVMLLLVGYLHWQLALRSFNLITALPDRVSRWFGAAPEAAGEERQAGDVRGLLIHSSQSAARGAVPRTGGHGPGGVPPAEPVDGGTVAPVGEAAGGMVAPVGDAAKKTAP